MARSKSPASPEWSRPAPPSSPSSPIPNTRHKVKHTRAGAILVSEPHRTARRRAVHLDESLSRFRPRAGALLSAAAAEPGIHPLASVAPTARIGENASIGPFAVVGENVTIGRNAVLHPHVVIYEGAHIGDDFYAHSHAVVREFCRIGHRVILQNSVVVGGDGFGFAKRADGTHDKIVQSGVTVIEDDVEIQTLTSVDRATDGRNARQAAARRSTAWCRSATPAWSAKTTSSARKPVSPGSSILEKNVLLAGQVGVSGHLTIHDNAVIYAQSGIGGDVAAGAVISGSPAFEARNGCAPSPPFRNCRRF